LIVTQPIQTDAKEGFTWALRPQNNDNCV